MVVHITFIGETPVYYVVFGFKIHFQTFYVYNFCDSLSYFFTSCVLSKYVTNMKPVSTVIV